jgi:hypothetical protein
MGLNMRSDGVTRFVHEYVVSGSGAETLDGGPKDNRYAARHSDIMCRLEESCNLSQKHINFIALLCTRGREEVAPYDIRRRMGCSGAKGAVREGRRIQVRIHQLLEKS